MLHNVLTNLNILGVCDGLCKLVHQWVLVPKLQGLLQFQILPLFEHWKCILWVDFADFTHLLVSLLQHMFLTQGSCEPLPHLGCTSAVSSLIIHISLSLVFSASEDPSAWSIPLQKLLQLCLLGLLHFQRVFLAKRTWQLLHLVLLLSV